MSKPLEPNELKALKGLEVWLIPLYNAIERRRPLIEQITSDIIQKCGSKMFHLTKSGGYSFEGGYCNSNNYGYLPFKTRQDALDYLEVEEFLRKIKYQDLSHLCINEVRKLKEIIESKSQQNMQ